MLPESPTPNPSPHPASPWDRLWRLLDAGHSLDPLSQARLRSLQLAAATLLAGLVWGLVSFYVGEWLAGALLLCVGLSGVPVVLAARRLHLGLAGQLITTAVMLGSLAGVVSRGGIEFSASAWLLGIPISAYSFLGRRWGAVWTGVAILLCGGIWLGQDLGLLRFPEMDPALRWRLVLLDYLTLPGLIAFGMWTGYQGQTMAMRLLDQRNAALEIEVAERQAAERRALASVQAREAFLAVMSHEIRTPLNGVLGMTEVLLGQDLDAKQEDTARMVRSSGIVLRRLLDEVLDYSKIDAGKLELEVVPTQIAELGRELTEGLRGQAQDKGIQVRVVLHDGVPLWVSADPLRLRQILGNLLSNALKFTERGEICLEISGRSGDLHLQVRDTGIGMGPEQLSRVFAPFQQADVSTTRRFGGTGLGLAISKELVEAMGGRVEVESEPGQGSVFHLFLPLVACPPPAEISTPDPIGEDTGALTGLRVLVAEDNAVNQLVIRTLLERLGVDTLLVEDGQQAVAAWERWRPDLILMDVRMPELDGYGATQAIRARGGTLPVVALTANTLASDRARSREAGMDDHLGKPVEVQELTRCLLRWGSRRAA
ncbi:MAG: ATP-binding protein [Myxococcota bacterium]|nr:ATP-binding protein [Myxococcota bacterium]